MKSAYLFLWQEWLVGEQGVLAGGVGGWAKAMSGTKKVRKGRSVGSARDWVQGDCHRCFAAELRMRLRDWIWRNRGFISYVI